MGRRAGLDIVTKRKIHFTTPAGNRTPIVHPLGLDVSVLSPVSLSSESV